MVVIAPRGDVYPSSGVLDRAVSALFLPVIFRRSSATMRRASRDQGNRSAHQPVPVPDWEGHFRTPSVFTVAHGFVGVVSSITLEPAACCGGGKPDTGGGMRHLHSQGGSKTGGCPL